MADYENKDKIQIGVVIMKKRMFLRGVLSLIFLGICITGCDNGSSPPTAYKVTFVCGKGTGTPPEPITVNAGEEIELPGQEDMEAPEGQEFNGWRGDGQTLAEGDFYTVDKNVTFTAQWKETNPGPGPSGKNPLEGTWLSESELDDNLPETVIYFGADTTGGLYRFTTNWNYSYDKCKVLNDTGRAYRIGYFYNGMQNGEDWYSLNSAEDQLTISGETYFKVDIPKTTDLKSPIAGFWVSGEDTTQNQLGLVISKALDGDYFTILTGECDLRSAYTIENGESKIGGSTATAYRYTLTENERRETILNIRIRERPENFIRADTKYPKAFF
ncbi:MAG: hypothetical protein LBQ14_09620 [Treponema sp.]|jgi:uncharacterized repeat protein (TIGR02543 family)|nr:hypothetical protein [Treponema sp.]